MEKTIPDRVAVVSDTHGDAACWAAMAGGALMEADMVVHAGDILYHGPRNPVVSGYDPGRLAEMLNGFAKPILFARGNCDSDVDQLVLDWPVQSPYLFAQVGPGRILACHGENLGREEMINLARRYKADIFIFGHTHRPFLERVENVILLNPGSPSLPKGESGATCALVTRREVKVVSLNGKRTVLRLARP
ncbi:MAG: phosphodiesterase [Peptococcaceae bacterium]|nr:phosphodiesterase [Peptococcaceae bacterium]